ncbi:unnamed protein product [Thlaspi arvense]|uniref:Malectin-like domain-containing protein n=1 Tax=Thlaspi arvense TaxID=13288 RepID=A0AAU9RCQ0_THLAR|nr:unnamed protein product [Thlaspi arvense]
MMVSKALTFFCFMVLINLANAQDQKGFISIDCGLQPESSSYTETSTGIKYVSDSSYTDTGASGFVSPENRENMMQSMWSVRSFPEGDRNCYTIGVNESTKYLIRAAFMYGNYDSRNEIPEFDLHLGPNKWDTVKLESPSQTVAKEMIHHASTDALQVCLVDTGNGTPFISALELRELPNASYVTQSESIQLLQRLDYGSSTNQTVRFPDDDFDRIWFPSTPNGSKRLSSSSTSLSRNRNGDFRLPQVVMSTAIVPESESGSLSFGWTPDDPSMEFYFYMYFTELQEPSSGSQERREFTVSLNGRTISRNLSSAGLTGDIASDISLLSELQVLNLANNQLSGPIPSVLMERNGMSFSINGNPSICLDSACEEKSKKKKLPGFVIPLVASLAGVILIAAISAAILFTFMRRQKQDQNSSTVFSWEDRLGIAVDVAQGMSQVVTALKESLAVEVERKKHLPVVSTDSVEELALGFGSNPPPRLR